MSDTATKRHGLPRSRATRTWALAGALLVAVIATPTFAEPQKSAAQDAAFVDALTWGVTPSSMEAMRAQGRDRWLKEQLHPGANGASDIHCPMPCTGSDRRAARPLSRNDLRSRDRFRCALPKAANQLPDPDAKAAARKRPRRKGLNDVGRQAATASILHALYAPDQIRARLTWFWFNHFNVHMYKANLRLLVGDYEQTIRTHMRSAGFAICSSATVRHPAMLRYLDNAENAAGRINENYAREIMELHTLGVGNYTQKDVEELARIFTGVGIDLKPDNPKLKPEWAPLLVPATGSSNSTPRATTSATKSFPRARHPRAAASPRSNRRSTFSASAPATAHHIAQQIAIYFVGDDPPSALVDTMAQAFTRTNGDIAAVIDTMARSPAFTASLGTRFKDPVRYVFSAVRFGLRHEGRAEHGAGPELAQPPRGGSVQSPDARRLRVDVRRCGTAPDR